MTVLLYVLGAVALLVGLVGIVLPGLPGALVRLRFGHLRREFASTIEHDFLRIGY